jgi:hypothetical protein
VPRPLGVGGALTILRFAPLVWLHPVPGYNAHWERVPGSCAKGADCRTRDNKEEGETSREAIFFIFRPFQEPSEPRQGFWDAAEPLEQSFC